MNQFKLFLFTIFTTAQIVAQQQQLELNYLTEMPFQTSNDTEYYHLESSLLLRGITADVFDLAQQFKSQKKDLLFKLYFKSKTGASLSIDYAIDAMSLTTHLSSSMRSDLFKKYTYDWINRSFRSNIPYKD
jgi:hypothetical protein|tara:strand:+ start:730 stop:1122 length:393 start_codon:yes stop_codon:yes gene_type:complete